MQPDLKEQLEAAAQQAGRSLNAEIVARLESSFSTPEHAILLSAFERLNTELARVEVEKLTEQAQTTLFALNLRAVCEQLLPHVTSRAAEEELRGFIADASAVIHGANDIESQFTKRIEALAETIRSRKQRPPRNSG
jgi:uncharacterized protein YcgL (UPF0745 family)